MIIDLRFSIFIFSIFALASCSRQIGLVCEEPTLYTDSIESSPLLIPDDLDVPAEDNVLRIPKIDDTEDGSTLTGPCIESAPNFYEA